MSSGDAFVSSMRELKRRRVRNCEKIVALQRRMSHRLAAVREELSLAKFLMDGLREVLSAFNLWKK